MAESKDDIIERIALERGFANADEVATARDVQKKAFDVGLPQTLDQVLLARGVLNPDTLQELSNAVAVTTGEARIIAGYEVVQKLGQGGMGAVYKARRQSTGEFVALKILPPSLADDETIERFRREGEIVSALHHDNIVGWIEFGFDPKRNCHFCALEFIDGQNVIARIRDDGTIPEEQTLKIVRQIACALEHASAIGLIHRDVKPENIMVTKEGRALLLDLGLARVVRTESTRLTQTGIFVGTVHYCSPEQAKGEKELDVRSDIYSLGASMYHMLTGHPPFGGDSALVILEKHLEEKLRWPTGSGHGPSHRIRRVVGKMMAKRPEDRYQSPAALIRDLDLLLEGKEPEIPDLATHKRRIALRRTKAHPTIAGSRGRGMRGAPMVTAISLAVGALASAGTAFYFWSQRLPQETQAEGAAEARVAEPTPADAPQETSARADSAAAGTAESDAGREAKAAPVTPAIRHRTSPRTHPVPMAARAEEYEDTAAASGPRWDALADAKTQRAAEDAIRAAEDLLAAVELAARRRSDEYPLPEIVRLMADEKMAPALTQLTALRAAVHLLKGRRSAIRRTLQQSTGKKLSLLTDTGTQTGTVVSATKNGIQLDVAIAPGGRVIGKARKTIPWAALSHPGEEALAGDWQTQDENSLIAVAIISLAIDDVIAAEKAAAAAGEDHPLAELVAKRICALGASQQEAAAQLAWEKIEKRADGNMTAKDAKATLQRIAAFEEQHIGTAFLQAASERLAAVQARCESAIPKSLRTRVVFWDEFDDPDLVNQTWTQWVGRWQVYDESYHQTRMMDNQVVTTGNTSWANYSLETRLRMNGDHDLGTGVAFRIVNRNNYYVFTVQLNAATAKMTRYIDGRPVVIASGSAPSDLLPWQWYRLRVDVRRNDIKAYLDGELVVDCADAVHKRGMVGLKACNDAWFDYVRVTLIE